MAVQAHYPSEPFSQDFRGRSRINAFEDLMMLQGHDGNLLGGQRILNGGTVFSGPESELTSNASGSRKRNREDPSSMALSHPPNQNQSTPQRFRYPNLTTLPAKTEAAISTGLHPLSHQRSRMYGSLGTSTSGRPEAIVSPLAQELVSELYLQSLEFDALVRLQNERLRFGLEETLKRHRSSILSVLEQQVLSRLMDKETELQTVSRRNAELEEQLRQMSTENLIWFNAAMNSETIVSSLRTSLEQVLLQSSVAADSPAKEGSGDSDAIPFPADDAQSCCFDDESRERKLARVSEDEAAEVRCRRACRVCGEKEVCVLLLPCRHLCLCKDCESRLDTCPTCHTVKTANLQIIMS